MYVTNSYFGQNNGILKSEIPIFFLYLYDSLEVSGHHEKV